MSLIPSRFYLDNVFDDLIPSTKSSDMRCDIYEKDGDYHIVIDIPGFNKNDIKIEADNGYLTITASKESEENEEEKNYIRRERVYGKYERSFYLGDLESESIKAEFKDGILSITVPKKEVESSKKTIQID